MISISLNSLECSKQNFSSVIVSLSYSLESCFLGSSLSQQSVYVTMDQLLPGDGTGNLSLTRSLQEDLLLGNSLAVQ